MPGSSAGSTSATCSSPARRGWARPSSRPASPAPCRRAAVNIFTRFEEQKFARDRLEAGEAKDETRRYLGCDLLILDDLGSELSTPFVQSALYTLINTRLTADKRTVISSNLTMDQVRARYTPQIASRLEGEYRVLPFYGEDIRLLRKQTL